MELLIIGLVAIIILLLVSLCKLVEINRTIRRTIDYYEERYLDEKAKVEFYEKQIKEIIKQ